MGQIRALFYKQIVLTKRQKVGCCCQIVTPIISLIIIIIINYLSSTISLGPSGTNKEGVKYIFHSNLMKPEYGKDDTYGNLIKQFYNISNNSTRLSWAVSEKSSETESINYLKDTFTRIPKWFWTKVDNADFKPTFNNNVSKYNTVKGANKILIDKIKKLNNIAANETANSNILPDGMYLFNDVNDETGFNYNLQTNNILFTKYHRDNGFSIFKIPLKISRIPPFKILEWEKQLTPTEGFLSGVNLISNLFLNKKLGYAGYEKPPQIISLISPTVDSSNIKGFLDNMLSMVTIYLFPISMSMGFPLMLYVLVMEKEESIKELLDINGLKTINYWFTTLFYYFINFNVVTLVFLTVGWLFVDYSFFNETSALVVIIFFVGWNLAQVSLSLLLSTFIKTSKTATFVGYIFGIFSILMFADISTYLYSSPGKVPIFLQFIPQMPFSRCFYLMISGCVDNHCIKSISELNGELLVSIIFLYIDSFLFFVIGFFLNEKKTRQWVYNLVSKQEFPEFVKEFLRFDGEEEDIRHISATNYNIATLRSDPHDEENVLVAKRLTKVYPVKNGKKVALRDFSLCLKKDQIFGLLGPNGAGKTTFLSVLTGSLEIDRGEAYLCGQDVNDKSQELPKIGFCPQFDILYPLMNVEEHFIFFSMFKGLSKKESTQFTKQLINDVGLELDFHKRANKLSGGMRRRCSLGIALTGNSTVVFLDEPSSGLDPVKRRNFWALIKQVTKGKAVLLTTHLMEEADTLCDKIGIMTTGQLRCVGNSIYLKQNLSKGIKLQIVVNRLDKTFSSVEAEMNEIKEQLRSHLGDVMLKNEFQGTMNFEILSEKLKISNIFETIKTIKKSTGIEDWSISLGSLEDVFLEVVKRYRGENVVKKTGIL